MIAAAFRISPKWDFVGSPRTVLDDQIEARAAELERQYAADPVRIAETLSEALMVVEPRCYRDHDGSAHSFPGISRGKPLIAMLLAGDDLAFCTRLRELVAIKAKADAEHDACDDALRGAA